MEGKNGASRMLLLLYGMLILALLVLAAAGAKLCGAALGAAREHDHRRTALAFIQSRTAACEGSAGRSARFAPASSRSTASRGRGCWLRSA